MATHVCSYNQQDFWISSASWWVTWLATTAVTNIIDIDHRAFGNIAAVSQHVKPRLDFTNRTYLGILWPDVPTHGTTKFKLSMKMKGPCQSLKVKQFRFRGPLIQIP